MVLHVVFLLLWVCWLHSVFGQDYEDDNLPAIDTITHFPEVKDGKCVFPFQYRGGIFYDCIKFKAKHKWCSLTKTYQGQWKYCSEEDALSTANALKTGTRLGENGAR
uniref:binder of sperm protein homolog 1-like isoform X2 n=1 Tax=Panthera onca TaxID=9690 RepID=UPI0029539CA3|nr:binder of sperm protein homolog 1-like isoform X2 [Panthera onca]